MMKRFFCCLMVLCLFAGCAKADKRLRITFAGDVTLGSEERLWQEETSLVQTANAQGDDYFFARVKPLFDADDLTVVNLEGVLSDSAEGERRNKTYRFRGPSRFASILTAGGIEMVSVANNHTFDYSDRGFQDTLSSLEAEGIAYFGGRCVRLWEKNGIKLAFLGLSYTDDCSDERAWVEQEIARLKAEDGVSAVIFTYHGGQEYSEARTKKQQDIARMAVDAGADLVVMHHPHVVQGMSVLNGRSVLYSLGNFCFGGNKNVRAMQSLIAVAELAFSDEGSYLGQQVCLYPAHVSGTEKQNDYQPQLVTGKEARRVMRLVQADTRFTLEPFDEELGCAAQVYLPAP